MKRTISNLNEQNTGLREQCESNIKLISKLQAEIRHLEGVHRVNEQELESEYAGKLSTLSAEIDCLQEERQRLQTYDIYFLGIKVHTS
jgi:phage host-nuclease inhibitor protein Gam